MKMLKKGIVLLLCCLLGFGAVSCSIITAYNEPATAFEKQQPVEPKTAANSPAPSGQPVEEQDQIVNVLLLGIDSTAERVQQRKGYRSDTIMLCSFNMDKETLTMVSIPRDTSTEMNKLDYETGEVVSRTTNRINAAYAFGGGPDHFGAQNAVDCVSEFLSCNGKFDIPIHHYVSIDIDGILAFTDAIGGVEVTLDRTLRGVGQKGETVVLDGEAADIYLRNRKSGGGDEGRVSRQQEYVMAMGREIKEMGVLEAVPAMYGFVNQYAKTDLTLEQIAALIGFLSDYDLEDATQFSVTSTNNGSRYVADIEELENFILAHPLGNA